MSPTTPDSRPWTRRLSWAATLAVLLGLLLVVPQDTCTASSAGACVLPDDPLPAHGRVGEPQRLRLGTVTVTRAEATQRLGVASSAQLGTLGATATGSSRIDTVTTDDRFVVVTVRAESADQPRPVVSVLHAGDRTYTHLDTQLRFADSSLTSPGLPVTLQSGFHVPTDALQDDLVLELHFSRETSDTALVDLGRLTTGGTVRMLEQSS